MVLIVIGASLMIAGVLLAAVSTMRRGQLSESPDAPAHETKDSLEPSGRGRRLSIKSDIPGFAMFILGAILVFAGM